MGIYFIKHAEERFIEHGIPARKINLMLKKGVIIENTAGEKKGRKICIYKEGYKYYSIVFLPCNKHKFIITGYPSKERERKIYDERPKK